LAILKIDGHMLRKAIIAGANELEREKDYIDSLNVFPVPDGDTGINMSLTAIAAAKEVEKLDTPNIYDVAKAASNGSLRGARGNSGVILSQLFRGFAKGLENKTEATAEDLASAFVQGSAAAYKAVMKPKEGTMLTVSKALALAMAEGVDSGGKDADIEQMVTFALEHAFKCLEKTTEMLPELKQANVVDAGAYGFLKIIVGGFESRNVEGEIELNTLTASKPMEGSQGASIDPADIKFAYCTEFIIDNAQVTPSTENSLKKFLSSLGDSVVVVVDEDIVKVHVHTNNPGLAMERALTIGSLDNIKIENMRSQHTESAHFGNKETPKAPEQAMEHKENAFIAVASGDGLCETLRELGADLVVSGGQSMNPSTEDILDAISKLSADNIFVLPNNKNIILAAEQAAILSDKSVYIVPTKTIPQGITALISFMPEAAADENIEGMKEALQSVRTGMVTHAVRASSLDGMEISDGDVLGIIEDKINIVSKNVMEGAKRVIDKLFEDGEGDVLSIYYGESVTDDEAQELVAYAEEKYPSCDCACVYGGQPIYHYVLSLE